MAEHQITHGGYKNNERELSIWKAMIGRCLNRSSNRFYRYGGRGIKICKEWENSYESFRKWARENGYKDTLQIDRIDNDGDYCPENCRWVTPAENSRNRSSSKLNINQVLTIKWLLHNGFVGQKIANVFGVSKQMIYRIKNGKAWVL